MTRNEWERAHKIAQAIHAADMEWTSKFSARMSAIAVGDTDGEQAADKSMLKAWDTMSIQGVKLATIMLELGPMNESSGGKSDTAVIKLASQLDAYPPSHPGFNRVIESIEQHDPNQFICMPAPLIAPDDSLIGAISPEHQDDESYWDDEKEAAYRCKACGRSVAVCTCDELHTYPVGATAVYNPLRVLVTIVEARGSERRVWSPKRGGSPFSSYQWVQVTDLSQSNEVAS